LRQSGCAQKPKSMEEFPLDHIWPIGLAC
jgi:hypothetical protein